MIRQTWSAKLKYKLFIVELRDKVLGMENIIIVMQ